MDDLVAERGGHDECSAVDDRANRRRNEISVGSTVSGPQLKNLTDASANAVLMTLNARLCVVDGTEPVCFFFARLEGGFIGVEGSLVCEAVG